MSIGAIIPHDLSVLFTDCLFSGRSSVRSRNRNLLLLAAMLFACAPVAFAQTPRRNPYPEGPALLFREGWQQPPGAKPVGEGDGVDDVVTRIPPASLSLVGANT